MNWFSYFKSVGACIYEVLLLWDLAGQLLRKCDCKLWKGSVCNVVYRYGWPSVCGLTRNFQEVQFLEIKKKAKKKKKVQRTTTVKCVCMKSLVVDYLHFMPFKNLLKFRKVNMAKYIYMLENLMQCCEELFTPLKKKKKQLEFEHYQNIFLFNVFAFFC